MKVETTIKYIKNNFKTYRCGYCELQNIMAYDSPQYYNSGVYGWNCDIYIDHKNNIAITTGYRNMTGDLIPVELIKKYDDIALNIKQGTYKDILGNTHSLPFSEIQKALEENKKNFFDEVAKL